MTMDLGISLRKAGHDCRDALDRLVQQTSHQALAWPSELQARFGIWAKEALIYNEGDVSLDHQIRRNATVRAMVWQLLDAIRANAEAYTTDSKRRNEITAQPPAQIIEANRSNDAGLEPENSLLYSSTKEEDCLDGDETLFRINDGIARLVRLSRRMRQHIREKMDVKADSFDPPDEHGKALTKEFCEHLDWTLSQHPECHIENLVVRERLRQTMLLRWRRIVFHSQRAKDKTLELCKPEFSSVRWKQDIPVLNRPPVNRPPRLTDQHQNKQNLESEVARSLQSDEMTIGSSLQLKEDNRSVASSRRTKSLAGLRQSDFPSAPAIIKELSGFICPLCGSRQLATERESKTWRLHVLRDLAPYICLYDKCGLPTTRYRTTKEWLAHMDEMHRDRIWLCQTCNYGFEDQQTFEEHFTLTAFHDPPVRLSLEDIALLVKLSAVPRTFTKCLFCNLDSQEVEDDIRLHMAEHLRHFALMSIPWHVLAIGSSEVDSASAVLGAKSRAENSSVDRMERSIDGVSLPAHSDPGERTETLTRGIGSIAGIKDMPQPSDQECNEQTSHWLDALTLDFDNIYNNSGLEDRNNELRPSPLEPLLQEDVTVPYPEARYSDGESTITTSDGSVPHPGQSNLNPAYADKRRKLELPRLPRMLPKPVLRPEHQNILDRDFPERTRERHEKGAPRRNAVVQWHLDNLYRESPPENL